MSDYTELDGYDNSDYANVTSEVTQPELPKLPVDDVLQETDNTIKKKRNVTFETENISSDVLIPEEKETPEPSFVLLDYLQEASVYLVILLIVLLAYLYNKYY